MFQDRSGAFEAYCQRCRVSFPVGTKTCLHCGGRISRERAPEQLALPPPFEAQLPAEDLPQRGGLSPITIFWVLLALAGGMYRACH